MHAPGSCVQWGGGGGGVRYHVADYTDKIKMVPV